MLVLFRRCYDLVRRLLLSLLRLRLRRPRHASCIMHHTCTVLITLYPRLPTLSHKKKRRNELSRKACHINFLGNKQFWSGYTEIWREIHPVPKYKYTVGQYPGIFFSFERAGTAAVTVQTAVHERK